MIPPPNVDGRRVERFVRALHSYAAQYTPDLDLTDSKGVGTALFRIFAQLAETVAVRLDRAPQKHFVAFLDALGVVPVPARAARAAVAFKLADGLTTPVRVPADTRVTAPGPDEEIPFETVADLVAIPGALSAMYGVDPAEDVIFRPPPDFLEQKPRAASALNYVVRSFANAGANRLQLDHVTDLKPGSYLRIDCREKHVVRKVDQGNIVTLEQPLESDVEQDAPVVPILDFEVFNGINIQEHVLYLGHSRVLNVKAEAVIRVTVELTDPAAAALDLVWEFWTKDDTAVPEEEEHWHLLPVQADGTNGFSRSGVIELLKPVKESGTDKAELEVKTRLVNERESRWIRARVQGPLPGGADALPTIASIRIGVESPQRTVQGQRERVSIPADQGFYNATPLDVQVDENIGFFPFGSEPRQFDQFYIASKEAFSKRGAEVTLTFQLDIQTLASPSAVLLGPGKVAAYSIGQRRRLYELTLDKGAFEILGDPSQQAITGSTTPSRYLPLEQLAPAAVANETGTKVLVFVATADALDREPPHRLWVAVREPQKPSTSWVDLDAPPPPQSGKKQIPFDPAAVRLTDGTGFARVFVVSGGKLYSQLVPDTPQVPGAWTEHGQPPDGAVLTSAPWVEREPTTNTLLVYVTGIAADQHGVYELRVGANTWARLNDAMVFDKIVSRPFARTLVDGGAVVAKVFVVARDAPNADPKLFERDTRAPIWVDLGSPAGAILEGHPSGFLETPGEPIAKEGKHIFVLAKLGDKERLYQRLDGAGAQRWHDTTRPEEPDLRGSPSVAVTPDGGGITHIDVVVASVRNSLLARKYRIRRGQVMATAAGRAAFLSPDTPSPDEPGGYNGLDLTVFDDQNTKIAETTIEAYDDLQKLARLDDPVLPAIDDTVECEIEGDEPRPARDGAANVLPVHDPIEKPTDLDVVDFRLAGVAVEAPMYSPLTGLLRLNIPTPAPGTLFSLQTVLALTISESRPREETDIVPELSWEYWNGRGWLSIPGVQDGTRSLLATGDVTVREMPAVEATEVAGQDNFWIRVRLVGGDYGREIFRVDKNTETVTSDKSSLHPPKVATLRIVYVAEPVPLETCLTFNNLNYLDQTAASQLSGANFLPFEPLAETMRAVFLGFERPFKSGPVRVLFDAAEREVDPGRPPALRWQFRKDHDWRDVAADDESQALTRQGLLTLSAPEELTGDTLFGKMLFWVRGMLRDDREDSHTTYPNPLLRGVFPNTVWASQGETITDEIVASSDGSSGQRHPLQHDKVLREQQRDVVRGEEIRVREALSVEEREQIVQREGPDSVIDRDDVGGPWVRWTEVRAFFDAGPTDRCYAVDRAAGILRFGDGIHGAIPPAGTDNIRAFRYRTGGGTAGNVAPGSINTLATAVQGVESVFNPTAGGGGSDTATTDTMLRVGPQQISHRDRAVSPEDFEELAVEATRQVAKARCLASTRLLRATSQVDPCHPAQRHEAHDARGWVSVIIVPRSPDPLPCPSLELRRTVRDYLRDRAPALLVAGDRLVVRPPDYVVVSIAADLFVASLEHAASVEEEADRALRTLLHPLDGGPEGLGWEFGRPIAASDVFARLEAIRHVDHVESLGFAVAGRPDSPDGVEIGPHQLLASGTHTLRIRRNGT